MRSWVRSMSATSDAERLRLRLEDVVDGELLQVRLARKRAIAELLERRPEPALHEAVEAIAGLPEVDDSPAPVDRSGRVENQAVGRVLLHTKRRVKGVVLLLRAAV